MWEDLDRVLQQIREVDGPIEGVLHGAGVVHDAAFRRKKPAHVRETFAAKNVSAAALIELTKEDPLRHFVAFGSMSGRLGMTGQTDYSAANDLLAKQIDSLRHARPECRSVAIHWHAWGETGVAARPELQATFASLDIKFMPPAEGVAHLIRELESGTPESEVLLTDAEGCRKQYPHPAIAIGRRNSSRPLRRPTRRGSLRSSRQFRSIKPGSGWQPKFASIRSATPFSPTICSPASRCCPSSWESKAWPKPRACFAART